MGLPVIDDYHQKLNRFVKLVSDICMSGEFLALKKELESIYSQYNVEGASILAFQDALYAIIAQEEMEV